MWHWLPSVLPRKMPLFFRLLVLVGLAHCLLIVSYALLSRSQPLTIHVSRAVFQDNRIIRVLPFVRNTGQLNRVFEKVGKSHTSRSGFSAIKSQKSKLRIRRSEKGKTAVEGGAKKSEKKIKNVHGVVQELPKIKIKKSKKGQKGSVNEAVKPVEKPVAPPPVILPQKGPKQSVDEKKDKLIPAELVAPKKSVVQQESVAEVQSVQNTGELENVIEESSLSPELMDIEMAGSDDGSPIVLGQQEFELLQTYRAIYEEMNQQWHPPVGLRPAKQCIILVTINEKGCVSQVCAEQPSGVLAYDLAARMAVNRANFPKGVWNQQVRLHF